MIRCDRCGGSLFPAEEHELSCLQCGARVYHRRVVFVDRVLAAMGDKAEKERRKAERGVAAIANYRALLETRP